MVYNPNHILKRKQKLNPESFKMVYNPNHILKRKQKLKE
jgi:hypothetical protein